MSISDSKADPSYTMLPIEEALAIVLSQTQPLTPRPVALSVAFDKILAEAVIAHDPLPPFPASIKDGYAVVASDGIGTYPVIGSVTAGQVADFRLQARQAAYITTGAPLPAGADAVVMVEETTTRSDPEKNQSFVTIHTAAKAGQDVRPVGFDIAVGETVLEAGTRLGAAEIGLLATVGAAEVKIYPPVRVAVLSTGDELADIAQGNHSLQAGQIRDSNRAMLCAAIQQIGGQPIDMGIARDQREALQEKVIAALANADILLTSGGVSVGALDYMKTILAEIGTIHFGRLRMKPGKPCTFATIEPNTLPALANHPFQEDSSDPQASQRKLIFGLPGNPVSSLVTFYLIAAPAIRQMAGYSDPRWRRVQAHLTQPLALDPYRPEYHRAMLRWETTLNGGAGGWLAQSTGSQASSRLLSARSANALLELPQAEGVLAAGSVVNALWIGT